MTDSATFTLTLDGATDNVGAIFAAFKKQVVSDVADIQRTTNNLRLFETLDSDLKKSAQTVDDTRAKLAGLLDVAKQLQAAGDPIGKDLANGIAQAQRAADKAEQSFIKQSVAVDKLRTSLKTAGVDLSNLGAAEAKLAIQADAATKAQTDRTAAQALGLVTLRDTTPEVQRLFAAYNTLASSGSLSVKELTQAQAQLQTKVAEVRASVTGIGTAAKSSGPDLVGLFQKSIVPALGLTLTIAGVVGALKDAVEQANAYKTAVAEIGTVTDLSSSQLNELGKGARQLATDLGIDVKDALKGVFDLLRSGVPADNVLEVLRVAAEAAKAGLTDVGTGVKAAQLLLDAFGAAEADLPNLFDKITRAAHLGGATLGEFAASAGPLLNVARAAGIGFDDLLATLTVLVSKSGNAEKSIGDLSKIIAKIDTEAARTKLRDLGITGDTLVEIFTQIGAKGLSLNEVLGLGLSGAGVKGAASLAALTKNAGELPAKLDAITNSAGATAKSLGDLFDTPSARAARFNAALTEASIQIGTFVGSGSKLAAVATTVLNVFNDLPDAFSKNTIAGTALDNSVAKWVASLFGVEPATTSAKEATRILTEQQRLAREETALTEAAIKRATASFNEFATALTADIKALQDASARDIGDVQGRADALIAALDRSKAAEAETAAAILAIRLKLAKDQLAIIQASEKAITEATTAAIAAREKLARAAGATDKQLAADAAAARIASIAPVLTAYQKLYASLIDLAQTESAKVQGFEDARIAIAQKVEDALRAIRLQGLSALDQYVEKNKEVDRLVSEGRKKAVEGDTAAATKFFDQAIAAANGLTKVIDENGTEVISKTQAEAAQVTALKKIQDAANESFGAQAAAAKEGADAAIASAAQVGDKITELQAQYDALKTTVAEGLDLKVVTDEQSVATALAILDDLTKPRTVTITIETVNKNGQPVDLPSSGGPGDIPPIFARGGFVQRFAQGGQAIFRRPTWARVPGSGNEDTVPALLQAGSFVVRRSASDYYGGDIMNALARGYAAGGDVGGIANQILLGGKSRTGLASTVDQFQPIIDDLFKLRENAQTLPHSSTGLDIAEWAARIIEKFPLFDDKRKQVIKTIVEDGFDGWIRSIEEARRFHVPAVMDFSIAALAFRRGGGGRGLGLGTDTVPAMLTPGEFVVSKRAVQNYGSGLLHAVNSMRIPREALAGMLTAPRPIARFATGGQVGAPRGPVTLGAAGTVHVTINVDGKDLLSDAQIQKRIIPAIDRAMRISSKRFVEN